MSTSVTLNDKKETQSIIGVAVIAGLLGTSGGFVALPHRRQVVAYPSTTHYELKLPSYSFALGPASYSYNEKLVIVKNAQESIKSSQRNLDPEIEKLVSKNLFDLI